jgi:cytochrome P450
MPVIFHDERNPMVEPVRASVTETVRVAVEALLPTLAGGVIKRRPAALAVAEKLRADRSAVALLHGLRERHGARPVRLRVPGRSIDLALSPDDVGDVLAATPTPFNPATLEKRAALGHFQPHGVLISDPAERGPRRDFNETVLQPGTPLHQLAAPFATAVAAEAAALSSTAALDGQLTWDTFNRGWWRLVRRVVLGEGARDDDALTDALDKLRRNANWAYAHPRREKLRQWFDQRLGKHLERAEEGSLAAVIAADRPAPGVRPEDQVAHWLFAFDAAGMAAFRALALLTAHPAAAERARAELAGADLTEPRQLEYLRACVLESVRLWPTTPALLRETVEDTAWGRAGTTVLIFTPFFHRDPELAYADRFEPEIWLDGRAADNPALVPFSAGPAVCPGRDLVLFCTSSLLAHLLNEHRYDLASGPVLAPDRPLPATLDNFHLRLDVS